MRTSLLAIVIALVGTALCMGKPLEAGPWLVDLGRDYPRSQQAGLSDADAEITLLFMEAAARVDPKLAEPYMWQYDMLTALGRPEEARQALAAYVRLQPDDIAAHLNWISLELESLQTAEARAAFCRARLGQPGLPGKVASDLHRRLAEFHSSRAEREQAVAEAKAAIGAYELNFVARQLLESLELPPGAEAQPGSDVGELLAALAASPNDPELAVLAADRLMAIDLAQPAEEFYAHAVAILRILDPQEQIASAMTDRAVALLAMGRDQDATQQVERAAEQYKAMLVRHRGVLGPDATAEIAWFYAFFKPEPQEAEKLARVALAEAPESLLARRALGSALRQLGRTEEAKQELTAIADRDAVAAAELVQLLAAGSDAAAARQAMDQAATRPAGPVARLALARAAKALDAPAPASRPAPPESVLRAVREFPRAVLDYPLRPDKYMSLGLSMPQAELPPGEPWLLTATLKNVGPFAVTMGPGMMLTPDLLVSVSSEGDRPRATGPTLPFSFNRTPVLMPGESVQITHTIDLGAIRSGMIGTPQMTQDVTVGAVLSPITLVNEEGHEVVAPDVGGLLAAPLKFRRVAFKPTPDDTKALFAGLKSADAFARIRSLEVLAMLLAEHQHLRSRRLQYPARPIDAASVQSAILAMTGDPDWYVRARLAEVLRWFALDRTATQAATTLLNDSNWLVRGLAMRALADHHGAKFQNVLTQASQADPEPWVRRLTGALNQRITAAAAATQPATPTEQER